MTSDGLVEGADQILLAERVDRGLAADRAVGLGEQGRRHVDDRAAALEQGGGKPGNVADAAAAKRDDRRRRGEARARQARPAARGAAAQSLAASPSGTRIGSAAKRFGDACAVKPEDPVAR